MVSNFVSASDFKTSTGEGGMIVHNILRQTASFAAEWVVQKILDSCPSFIHKITCTTSFIIAWSWGFKNVSYTALATKDTNDLKYKQMKWVFEWGWYSNDSHKRSLCSFKDQISSHCLLPRNGQNNWKHYWNQMLLLIWVTRDSTKQFSHLHACEALSAPLLSCYILLLQTDLTLNRPVRQTNGSIVMDAISRKVG